MECYGFINFSVTHMYVERNTVITIVFIFQMSREIDLTFNFKPRKL